MRLVLGFAAAALSLIVGATATAAQLDRDLQPFTVRPQALRTALRDFAHQSQLEFMAPASLLERRHSPGVRGSLTRAEALSALLRCSGLSGVIEGSQIRLMEAPASTDTCASGAGAGAPSV